MQGRKFTKVLSGYGVLLSLVLLCVVIGVVNPIFFSFSNLSNVLVQSAVITIIAIGMTAVIIAGGIDLSVGSVVAFSGMVLGYMLHSNFPLPYALILALIIGALCGSLSGIVIAFFKVPPFIATLGMMSAARGLALMVRGGRSFSGFGQEFQFIGNGALLGVQLPILLLLIVFVLGYFFMKYTYWGQSIYAIGGNEKAAWLSGIRIKAYTIGLYSASGFLCAFGAIILTARLNSSQPVAGYFYELDAIAAAVIGGASLSGGRGSIVGTLLGSLILAVLKNGLTILNVSSYVQQITIGTVIVAAVVLDSIQKK